MVWILFFYNSLPDVPKGCQFFSPHLLHRDFLKCNPTNTGHYRYPVFETFSYDEGCHSREVRKFLKINDPDKYVLFYTRHTDQAGNGKSRIVGYFKVGKTFTKQNKAGFTSSETVLLSKEDSIETNYLSRGVVVSWGKSSMKPRIEKILQLLISGKETNISHKYREKTLEVMDLLRTRSGQSEMISSCERCNDKSHCFWGKSPKEVKKRRLEQLYSNSEIENLLGELSKRESSDTVFNPYHDKNILNNLREYLFYLKKQHSSIMLVGRSPGFNGCRLTGIPFTSVNVIKKFPHKMFREIGGRIALPGVVKERTGTILWSYLGENTPAPILWNGFPFHPYKKGHPEISRSLTPHEIKEGTKYVRLVYDIFNPKTLGALGRVGEKVVKQSLPRKEIEYIRHPSWGGKNEFIEGMNRVYKNV